MTVRILNGHVLDHLKELPDASVHCVVTSPPYWGLRDYSRCECAMKRYSDIEVNGSAPPGNAGSTVTQTPDPLCLKCHGTGKDESLTVIWDAKEGCEHEWGPTLPPAKSGPGNKPGDFSTSSLTNPERQNTMDRPDSGGSLCRLCGAWHGQLGLEPTPELYVLHIVQVFQEVKRVLRDDGTLWLNMGDCYFGDSPVRVSGAEAFSKEWDTTQTRSRGGNRRSAASNGGLKPKDLIGMPWRVAFALQADGWYLRSDIIWAKPNPMPESVTDRPTKAHEYVFLLSKSARYYYDADAVREGDKVYTRKAGGYSDIESGVGSYSESAYTRKGIGLRDRDVTTFGRNLRTVWTIPTQPYPEAHFATFPEALAERCIKAGTSEKGCCAVCGAAWERVVDHTNAEIRLSARALLKRSMGLQTALHGTQVSPPTNVTVGFRPTCDHVGDPVPCVVLDPFGGSGTTGAVARGLGRSCILIEIKSQYVDLAKDRVRANLHALEGYA